MSRAAKSAALDSLRDLLGNRNAEQLRRALTDRRQLAALRRCGRVFHRPDQVLARYLTARGRYPWTTGVRTPIGRVAVTAFSHHDVLTIWEIFARGDYAVAGENTPEVVVDLGANIGLSALHFLTQGPGVRVHGVEPDPVNIERMRRNIASHEDRFVLHQAAVDVHGGTATFAKEPSGRYGHLGRDGAMENITVDVLGVNDLLSQVLEIHPRIGLVKVDIEGAERRVLEAIDHALLDKVDALVVETAPGDPLAITLPGFDHQTSVNMHQFVRRT